MADEKNQGISKIEAFIREGDFNQAYRTCNKLLLNFPESRKIRKLQKRIEKTVYEQNLKRVKNDLKNLKPLWKNKNYEELIKKLDGLIKYVPGYRPIEKDLFKVRKLYREQLLKEQKDNIGNYIKKIEEFIKRSKFEDAITECKNFLIKIPGYERVGLLEKKARDLLIVQKLKQNETLLKSNKFEQIGKFLNELLKINPNSSKVKVLLNKASKKETVDLLYKEKDFSFRSIEHINVLMQKKKWEKAISALLELIKVSPQDMKALELLDRARENFNKQLTKEVVVKIKELQKKFKLQRAKTPHEFIRL